MKILIASDVHGSEYYLKKLLERFSSENADKLILLGDIYNHGPRNPLPKDYSPLSVAKLLNDIKDKLIVIKGNCDSEVDKMISDFDFVDSTCLFDNKKSLFLTHGHVYNKDNMPKFSLSAVVYGHFHTPFIERVSGVLAVNVGSISLPKNNTKNSYAIYDNGEIIIKDLIDNSVIISEKLN